MPTYRALPGEEQKVRAHHGTSAAVPRRSAGSDLLRLQRLAGNAAVAALVGNVQRVGPGTATAPASTAGSGTTDQALKDREDKAITALRNKEGGEGGTFVYENPMSPRFQPPSSPPTAKLTIGSLVFRPPTGGDDRRSFPTQGQAQAFATGASGPAGAVVLSHDDLYFTATLSSTSASSLSAPNVWRFQTGPGVLVAVGTDGFVFTTRSYHPRTWDLTIVNKPEESLATTTSAAEYRELVGMNPAPAAAEGATQQAPKAPGVKIPPGGEQAFITSYLKARAFESLQQNRVLATKLGEDFTPQAGGKLGKNATDLIGQSRELAELYKEVEDKEKRLADVALDVWNKHCHGKAPWGKMTVKGRTQTYFEWVDEINGELKLVDAAKRQVLSMSPMLAALVVHNPTPTSMTDAAYNAKVSAIDKRVSNALSSTPFGVGNWLYAGAKSAYNAATSDPHATQVGDSELLKPQSEQGDQKAADQFRTKLKAVQKAIDHTWLKVTEGDTYYLLGLSGLRSRVQADIDRLGPENQAVKDKFAEMITWQAIVDVSWQVAGTLIQIGALFLPAGQFLSAAIGLGWTAWTSVAPHAEQWAASQASVDPGEALHDQQAAAEALLFDTITMITHMVELGVSFNGAIDDFLKAGKRINETTLTFDAASGSAHLPPRGLSAAYSKALQVLGVSNPFGLVVPAQILRTGRGWDTTMRALLDTSSSLRDRIAGRYVAQRLAQHRKAVTEDLLRSACHKVDEAHDITGAGHVFQPFGGTNPTSHLDFSVSGPHADEVVSQFGTEFRRTQGSEASSLFNTKVFAGAADGRPSPDALARELDAALASARKRVLESGDYLEEIPIGNGHTWRRHQSGSWCRFSESPVCLLPGHLPSKPVAAVTAQSAKEIAGRLRVEFKVQLAKRPNLERALKEVDLALSTQVSPDAELLGRLESLRAQLLGLSEVDSISVVPKNAQILEVSFDPKATNYFERVGAPGGASGQVPSLPSVLEFPDGTRVWRDSPGSPIRHESALHPKGPGRRRMERSYAGKTEHGNLPPGVDWERAHSLGQGTGVESPYGIMHQPT